MGFEKKQVELQRPTFLPVSQQVDWTLVTRAHHNVLLLAAPSVLDAALAELKPHLSTPVQYCKPGEGVPVPEPSEGTLVLLEVAGLNMEQQVLLCKWLDRFEDSARVISTTSAPLYSLVEAGTFLENLYYRLNLVHIDLTSDMVK